MASDNEDLLYLRDSDTERFSDIEELFGNKVATRSSASNVTADLYNKSSKPVKQFVCVADYDQNSVDYNGYDGPNEFDFYLSYLDNPEPSPSISGINPNDAFKDVFDNKGLQITIDNDLKEDNDLWDIPQLNSAEKTGPKVNDGLAKAINAAISVKSNKEAMTELEKQYARPENGNLKVPRVNKEIWYVMEKNAHAVDLNLEIIQKSIATGLIPLVQMAESLISKQDTESVKSKKMLGDPISMLANSFYNLSTKRRNEIKSCLTPRYKKIVSAEMPVTDQLFGDSCMSKLKEMGDINKHTIGIKSAFWDSKPKKCLPFTKNYSNQN
ncbi:uncharacterized protein LOC133194473 [Saccostrea echinata]|uniref:uncharacterized protein LOC133194473 n=1 Tax=Saccostrea echinata TaxID=191078 RepID=UPI002A83D7BD|nr:uncharacterized protein LOC133194473 [Saccostrea echinata]